MQLHMAALLAGFGDFTTRRGALAIHEQKTSARFIRA